MKLSQPRKPSVSLFTRMSKVVFDPAWFSICLPSISYSVLCTLTNYDCLFVLQAPVVLFLSLFNPLPPGLGLADDGTVGSNNTCLPILRAFNCHSHQFVILIDRSLSCITGITYCCWSRWTRSSSRGEPIQQSLNCYTNLLP